MNAAEQTKAKELFNEGESEKLTKFLTPFLKLDNPFALNLYSCFSQPGESTEEYDKRFIRQKISASELGSSEASYQMGVNYLNGDDIEIDLKLASKYFERAIEQGHSYTKFTYGFSLFYGTHGNKKNQTRGLSLMSEAANEGIELAIKEIDKIGNESI